MRKENSSRELQFLRAVTRVVPIVYESLWVNQFSLVFLAHTTNSSGFRYTEQNKTNKQNLVPATLEKTENFYLLFNVIWNLNLNGKWFLVKLLAEGNLKAWSLHFLILKLRKRGCGENGHFSSRSFDDEKQKKEEMLFPEVVLKP